VHLRNDEIEVVCDALWFVKLQGGEDEAQERLWTRLQPIRTGDNGGTELEPEEQDAVVRALRFVTDRVKLDVDEQRLLDRLAGADDPS
jgi:hypothetical protein